MQFKIDCYDKYSNARVGRIITSNSIIHTPVFMPVGTLATVKAVNNEILKKDLSTKIILANTYHLYLRPGIEVIKKAGGLHKFMNWDNSILSDSGGYQVYSLAKKRKISENGVEFQSHIDGSKHFFSPEKSIEIQRFIGADIIMAFDECTPYPCDYSYAKKSMELTHRWEQRSIEHFKKINTSSKQTIFPIVQGSMYKDLRIQSSEFVASLSCEGNAIGGLSVGEPVEKMYEITELCCSILPFDKPRYLMGVGSPANLLECISLGIDMFDCVLPTRNGRNGMLFTWDGIINIRNEKWKYDYSPIDEKSNCFVDKFSKAYLRHLFLSKEILGLEIASIHNLNFYKSLMENAIERIKKGDFVTWKNQIIKKLEQKI